MSEFALDPRLELSFDEFHRRFFAPRRPRTLRDLIRWAGSKSNYLAKKVVEECFGGVAFSAPTNEYLALCTVAVDDTKTGSTITEASYGGYARTQIGTGNNQTDAWNAATGTTTATVTNKNTITGPTVASGSSTIIALAVCDASSAGNVLGWCDVTSTALVVGDTPKVNAGGLSVVED
jgi:hypothetical protein